MALILLFVMIAAGFAVVIALAALPGKIAASRQHPQAMSVNICGWLGLPTGIVWVVAMAWAFWHYPDRNRVTTADLEQLRLQIDGLENAVTSLEARRKGASS